MAALVPIKSWAVVLCEKGTGKGLCSGETQGSMENTRFSLLERHRRTEM